MPRHFLRQPHPGGTTLNYPSHTVVSEFIGLTGVFVDVEVVPARSYAETDTLPLTPTAQSIPELSDGCPRKGIDIHPSHLGLFWRTEAVVCYPQGRLYEAPSLQRYAAARPT